jgi:hypothetical protein
VDGITVNHSDLLRILPFAQGCIGKDTPD